MARMFLQLQGVKLMAYGDNPASLLSILQENEIRNIETRRINAERHSKHLARIQLQGANKTSSPSVEFDEAAARGYGTGSGIRTGD
jgi:hypothetical protein